MSGSKRNSIKSVNNRLKIYALFLLLILVVRLLYDYLPVGQDWIEHYRPAALAMLHEQSPYDLRGFNHAPWTLLPLIPFALLPFQVGRVGYFILSFTCFALVAHMMKAKPVSVVIFLTSFPVVACLYEGGIEWLAMLAFVMPPSFCFIFAAMMPQVGIGISLFWLVFAWEFGGLRFVLRHVTPVLILLVASFALYGFWPLSFFEVGESFYNVALFPYLIPLGAYLILTRQYRPSAAASPFLSPHFTMSTLAVPMVALFSKPKYLAMASAVTWMYVLIKYFI